MRSFAERVRSETGPPKFAYFKYLNTDKNTDKLTYAHKSFQKKKHGIAYSLSPPPPKKTKQKQKQMRNSSPC